MKKTFAIAWRSRIGPAAGQGKRRFEREEAERLAEELNREYPGFIHEAVNTLEEEPSAIPAAALPAAA
jgi:hypothetical protein